MPSMPPTHLQPWQRVQSLKVDQARARTTSVDAVDHEKEENVNPLTIACRERYTRFERLIPALFPSRRSCCSTDISISDFEVHDEPSETQLNGSKTETDDKPAPPRITRKAEDDDYDMDDDYDALVTPPPAPPKPKSPSVSEPVSVSSLGGTGLAKAPLDQKKTAATTREELEAKRKALEDAARDSSTTMFYTLENDRDAMLEQHKLEESDRQVNAEANAQGVPGKLSTANLGASSLTLKHLIARIDAKRERVAVSDMDLRILMQEVKKNRSKWANEDKVGQEELYEASEKVVLELRALTEHSTAFLNRVNKREAPDYFNGTKLSAKTGLTARQKLLTNQKSSPSKVIKHPMDLGNVMKKLKQLQYKSKKEFVDDLMLIWDNCLKYNADPSHYLRKYALAMKKKTLSIIPLIPDITIRDRAEVEAEEAGAQDIDAEAESDDGRYVTWLSVFSDD